MIKQSKPKTAIELKYLSDLDVLKEYRKYIGKKEGELSLGELYERHNYIIHMVASKLFKRKLSHVDSFEDCQMITFLAAQTAYVRYDENRKGPKSKLSSYLYRYLIYEVFRQADTEAFVHCPPNLRSFRTYFMGGYDHDIVKKEKFEADNNIKTEEDYNKLKLKLSALLPSFLVFDTVKKQDDEEEYDICDYTIDNNCLSQNGLTLKVDLELLKNKMNDRQKSVYELLYEEKFTMIETAQILNITLGRVVFADDGIKKIFREYRRLLNSIEI